MEQVIAFIIISFLHLLESWRLEKLKVVNYSYYMYLFSRGVA